MDIENVSLTEVIAAARARHASLVPESAGYLLLGMMRAAGGRPVRVVAHQVMLNTEGVVTLVGSRDTLVASEAAKNLVGILGELLDVAQGKAAALRAVAEHPEPQMDGVFTGVTKALIPINRAAAKRALARLARETVRAKARGQLRPEDVYSSSPASLASPASPASPASTSEVLERDLETTGWGGLTSEIDIVTPTPPVPRLRIAVAASPRGGLPESLGVASEVAPWPGDDSLDALAPAGPPSEAGEITEIDEALPVAAATPAEALVAESLAAEPLVAEPVVAEPMVAEPMVAEPVVAEPVVAEPLVAEPSAQAIVDPPDPVVECREDDPPDGEAVLVAEDPETTRDEEVALPNDDAPAIIATASDGDSLGGESPAIVPSEAGPRRSQGFLDEGELLEDVAGLFDEAEPEATDQLALAGDAPPPEPSPEPSTLAEDTNEALANEGSVDDEMPPQSMSQTSKAQPSNDQTSNVQPSKAQPAQGELALVAEPSVEDVATDDPVEEERVAAPSAKTPDEGVASEIEEEMDPIARETELAARLAQAELPRHDASHGRVETLLADFGNVEGEDAVDEAMHSLSSLVSFSATPLPGLVSSDPPRRATLSIEREALRPRGRGPARIARPAPRAVAPTTPRPRTPTLAGMTPIPAAGSESPPPSRARSQTLAGIAATPSPPAVAASAKAPREKKPISMPRRGPGSTRPRELPFASVEATPCAGSRVATPAVEAPTAPRADEAAFRVATPAVEAAFRVATPAVEAASATEADEAAFEGGPLSASFRAEVTQEPPRAEAAVKPPPPDRLSVELSPFEVRPVDEGHPERVSVDLSAEIDREPEEGVPSLSPPLAAVDDRPTPPEPSVPPTNVAPRRRRGRGGFAALALVSIAAVALTIVGLRQPHLMARVQEIASPAPAASPQGVCVAELRLKDLPRPHEVLLRLGEAPVTQALPTGVRLEVVAMAPGRLPERLVIGPEAAWTDGPEGPQLSVELALERDSGPHWPPAPAGDVGGVGPRGAVTFASAGAPAEIWLVAGAGDEAERVIHIPCGDGATLLALNPLDPKEQRRLHIAPRLLETAAATGGAEISLEP